MAKKTNITIEAKSETIKAALAKLRNDARAALRNIGQAQSVDAIVSDVAVASLAGSDVEKALQKQYHIALIEEIQVERAGIRSELDKIIPLHAAALVDEEKWREAHYRAEETFDNLTAEQVISTYAAWVNARKTLEPMTARREATRDALSDCDKRIEAEREALRRLDAPRSLGLASFNGASVAVEVEAAGSGGRAVVEPPQFFDVGTGGRAVVEPPDKSTKHLFA